MKRWTCVAAAGMLTFSMGISAQEALLSADEAFPVTIVSENAEQAELGWKIPAHYYLYQHKIEVKQGHQRLQLDLPPAEDLQDDNYGHTQVYYQQLRFNIPTQKMQTYQVTWQGCAKDRVCYPPQKTEFQTDENGLVTQQNLANPSKRLLDLAAETSAEQTATVDLSLDQQRAENTELTSSTTFTATDQMWSEKLAQSSIFYGLLLFFGLGFLLAFTPCSLPMLPILTSLIVRDSRGLKAWMIALTFVTSMAMVYAILGLVASSAGLSFQRWLQQPSTLIAFSLLFVVFALNLFGLFELKLPRSWINRLDQAQSMQKGGSLVGAGVMGMISALLVGPCMTAPLAGALLFISQTHSQWQGALLLFTLGFGMGTPLLLASVWGSRVLPKAGMWMNQIKVLFAFIMLALALYFIRPLISEGWLQWLSLGLGMVFCAYVLWRILWRSTQLKWLYILVLCLALPYMVYSQFQHSQRFLVTQNSTQANWQVAHTTAEFQQLLAKIPQGQQAIIDVYADWCVACQPIEHQVLKSAAVQQALAPYYLIKLDLSQYDSSHQALLNQWDILGPPTYLFLNSSYQEIRGLRLTGTFTEAELLQQLEKFQAVE